MLTVHFGMGLASWTMWRESKPEHRFQNSKPHFAEKRIVLENPRETL